MKTILITIALAGLTTVGSYAQDKSCCCTKKATVHHKVAVTRHKAAPAKDMADAGANASNIAKMDMALQSRRNPACYSYKKDNIKVTECPDIMYDHNGDIQYSTEGAYMGYYPGNVYYKYYPLEAPVVNFPDTVNVPQEQPVPPHKVFSHITVYDNDCMPECKGN